MTKLRKILNNKQLSQSDLSRMAGINLIQINRYCTGATRCSDKNKIKIASALKMSVYDVFPMSEVSA